MARITLKGNPVHTSGELPEVGEQAPPFTLTRTDLGDCALEDFEGRRVVLNIFPSLDTATCATSVRTFNARAASLPNTTILCISADLPFAQKRFCGAEGLEAVLPLSTFRQPGFGPDYGLSLQDGPLRGLLARAVLVLDENGTVLHQELVGDIAHEPDYDAALETLTRRHSALLDEDQGSPE